MSVYLGCRLSYIGLLCNSYSEKGSVGQSPTNKGSLGAEASSLDVYLGFIFCLMDQMRLG